MGSTRDRAGSGANYGVQGRNVTAGVMAVGQYARAEKIVQSPDRSAEIDAALNALRQAMQSADIPAGARSLMAEDVAAIDQEARTEKLQTDRIEQHLKSLAGKVKIAGEMTGNVAGMVEPILKIASAIGAAAGVIGLL